MKKYFLSFSIALIIILTSASSIKASEGFFELRNQVGEAARCHVTSGIMEDQDFEILTLCRDILYPGGTEVFQYVVWADPIDGSNPIRLGVLGLGKQIFDSKKPFNRLFVTKELSERPRTPTGQVVMQGNLQSIPFLIQAPANTNNNLTPPQNELVDNPTSSPSPAPEAEEETAGTNNIFRVVALGGMLVFLAIFGVVLIIFVVSRR